MMRGNENPFENKKSKKLHNNNKGDVQCNHKF